MFLQGPRSKLLITGDPGVGKTTLVEKLTKYLSEINFLFKIRGFFTKEIRENGKRKGFKIIDPFLSREFLLAKRKDLVAPSETINTLPTIGNYAVFLEGLEKLLEEYKKDLVDGVQVFWVIDEVGKMEALSKSFCDFIENLLGSSCFLLATVGKGETPFLKKVFSFEPALRCEVTPDNRDFLEERLKIEFKRKGKLIVFEGIDGAGKTTVSKFLVKALKDQGNSVFWGCEPTPQGPYGKVLREKLQQGEAHPLEIKNLFLKDREWNVKNFILPKLKEGAWIVLDRYYLSTLSYQGAQGFDLKSLFIENETIAPLPDLVVYLDLTIDEALKRLNSTRDNLTFFEKTEFLTKVRENYLKILPWFNHVKLEATKPLEENLNYLIELLQRKFKSSLT